MGTASQNGLGLRIKGRAEKNLVAQVVRDLDIEDILSLQEERGTAPPKVQRMRERHHTLAKALADGISDTEAGILCDYSISRISILKGDPAFRELVTFYQNKATDRYLDMHSKLAGLGMDAVDELTARLEEDAEAFSIGQLTEVAKMAADRSGHGPSSKTEVDVRVGLADRMEAARKRAHAARVERMKDITPPEGDE